jgi:hypothetical protein
MVKSIVLSALVGFSVLGCTANSSHAVKPVEKDTYFECKADGLPHVFGSIQEMQKFIKTKKMTAATTEYIYGYAVVFDNTDPVDTARLIKEYEKSHK